MSDSDLFDDDLPEPEAMATWFKNSEHEGELLYILPKREGKTDGGKYEPQPMVVSEVRILDGPNKGWEDVDTELKGRKVVSQLRQRLDSKPGKAFVARLVKDGQGHVLQKATEADAEFAKKALAGGSDAGSEKPPF